MGRVPETVWGVVGDLDEPLLVIELVDRNRPGRPVLVVTGELCLATGEALEAASARYVAEFGEPVVLDLGGVSFMDASGLSSIVRLAKLDGGAQPVIDLRNVSAAVSRIVDLTSTDWLLRTEAEAGSG